jgi:hypothetical protein
MRFRHFAPGMHGGRVSERLDDVCWVPGGAQKRLRSGETGVEAKI